MRYHQLTTSFNRGIDLHARSMYVCVVDANGNVVLHQNIRDNDFAFFLKKIQPSDWEVAYLFSPFYAGDADLDFDGDGLTNRDEFVNGTNPRIAEGLLQILTPQQP